MLDCPECGKALKTKSALGGHRALSHGVAGNPVLRAKNRAAKQKRDALRTGTRTGPGCPECEMQCVDARGLAIHRAVKHGIRGAMTVRRLNGRRRQVDRTAGLAADQKRRERELAPQQHARQQEARKFLLGMSTTSADMPFECVECGNQLRDARALGAHRALKHGVKGEEWRRTARLRHNSTAPTPSELTCAICQKTFNSRSAITNHMLLGHRVGRDAPKSRQQEHQLKKLYGLSQGAYETLLARQGGGCAICGMSAEENGRALAVDHCHETDEVRGLLCVQCNRGLGHFIDHKHVGRGAEFLQHPTAKRRTVAEFQEMQRLRLQ